MYKNIARTEWFAGCMGMPLPNAARTGKLEDMFSEMEDAGVTHIVVPGRKAKNCFLDNKELMELHSQYPDKISVIPAINPLDAEAEAEITELVLNGNAKGIILEPGMHPETPMHVDDEKIFPIYDFCEKHEIPVTLACGSNAGPDQSYAMPVHVETVAVQFPKMKIVVTHGCWPWTAQACQIAFRRDNVYLSPDLYMLNTPGCQDYITAANYMCREKLIYGTSYPFATMKNAVQFMQTCGITEDALENILYRNAAKLLGLEG